MEDFAHKFVQLFDEYWYIILIIWAIQIIWTYKDFVEKVNRTTARINSDIENWKQYQTLLESYQHLNDIDSIWT